VDSQSTLAFIFDCLFRPSDVPKLTIYYLVWIIGFFIINIAWDIITPRTPPFHIMRFRDKISVLHNAAAFSSSLLIIIALLSPDVEKIARDSIVPLVLAAAAGILMTIPALCPYTPVNITAVRIDGGNQTPPPAAV